MFWLQSITHFRLQPESGPNAICVKKKFTLLIKIFFASFLEYPEARELYTTAIRTCPPEFKSDKAIFYSNRAACLFRMVVPIIFPKLNSHHPFYLHFFYPSFQNPITTHAGIPTSFPNQLWYTYKWVCFFIIPIHKNVFMTKNCLIHRNCTRML